MGLWSSIAGYYRVEMTCAAPADILTTANELGIDLYDVTFVDELRACANVYRIDLVRLAALLERTGGKLKIIRKNGIYWTVITFLKRPVLAVGMILLAILALYLPTRVLFVRVEGNQNVPDKMIIENAQLCGISFGASRRDVRSERMKNALLAKIPELQWAGVNTVGCVAVITVQERSSVSEIARKDHVSSIVASRDGIIQEMTVIRGNAQCRVGQAVKAGQLLVSGYTDCGIVIRAEPSEAEITAQTLRTLESVSPAVCQKRGELLREETLYQLRVGKNIINFCKDSGISDTTCVKMYEQKAVTLPGGFDLPVSVIKIRLLYYDSQSYVSDVEGFSWLSGCAGKYLQSQMLSGQILQSNEELEFSGNVCILTGKYTCLEMIGQVRDEEIVG